MSNPLCFALIELDGFLIGRSVADEAEILTLAVEPDGRRLGTGARLVQGFLAHTQKHGVATAFLEVAENNLPAIALYRQAGFAEIGLRRGYYAQPSGAGLNAVVMSRAV